MLGLYYHTSLLVFMRHLKQIIKTIQACKNEKEIEDFLFGILTTTEIEQLGIRYQIVKLLKQGMPQHQIAEKLGIGVATVTRGSKMLKEGKFKNVV